MPEMWSNTDFPYMCLKDRVRTLAFQQAIRNVVRPGDIVVDAGAGTGILSFFAAEAGARHVYAVEADPLLVATLRRSIEINHLADFVTVVPGDARSAPLPSLVDVCITEMIETALLDEMQVPVVNGLRARGVIGPSTRMIPESYTTFVELVQDDDWFYGFRFAAPKHEWPFYAESATGWHPANITALTDKAAVSTADFRGHVDCEIDTRVTLAGLRDGVANGLRLSGLIRLAPGNVLGQTNSLNGEKVLHLAEETRILPGQDVVLDLHFVLGEGLNSLRSEVASTLTSRWQA